MDRPCLRCGKKPTIDSHIFPKAAVRAFRKRGPDKKTIAVLANRAMVANTQNGIFDPNILCAACDQRIGVADKWFIENLDLFHSAALAVKPYESVKVAVDARRALQFAVSVIYRASLSRLDHFRDISLGPYNEVAGEIAVNSDSADFYRPFVIINVLTCENLDLRQFVFYPVKCVNGNGPYFLFNISGVQFVTKFGGATPGLSASDDLLSKHRVLPDIDVHLCCYPFDESAEAQSMRNVRRADRKTQAPPRNQRE